MKTLRALNTKLKAQFAESDECVHNLMAELRQVQEAMERMNAAQATCEASENAKLKDILSQNESKISNLVEKVVPLLKKNEQLVQINEM